MNARFYRKIVQKSRLDIYKTILLFAMERGYVVTSLVDWYDNYKDSNKKVLILRHDVDYDNKGAYDMYSLEKSLGVKSTFYFRWSTVHDKIMSEMHETGFEVSLHYETLAEYAKNNHVFTKEKIDQKVIEQCRNLLSSEIYRFEKRYFHIKTICSHGDKRNRILGIPNHVIVDQSFLMQHRLYFETYDKNIISKFDAYISDSSIYNGFVWQHSGSPFEMIKEEKHTICLLTHPIHWNQSFFKNIEMLFKIFRDNR